MNIALIGASGFIGSAIRREALARGHQVTALVTNPARLSPEPRLNVVKTDVLDRDLLARQLRGHDLVISAFSGHAQADVRGYYVQGTRSIVEAVQQAGVARLLVVGGAGSLQVQPGLDLLDAPGFPDAYRASAEGARDALRLLRELPDLDWTLLSPPAMIRPGERTGRYRVGGDQLLMNGEAPADISVEDYAVAMLDEAERPKHRRQRFTVAH